MHRCTAMPVYRYIVAHRLENDPQLKAWGVNPVTTKAETKRSC